MTRRAIVGLALCAVACSPGSPAPTPLREVTLPPLDGMSEWVAEQLQERFAEVERQRNGSGASRQRAHAYGELGKVLLGAKYVDAAEPAFANAAALDPGEMRWPYYLGHLHRARGAPAEAIAQFQRALILQPDHVPTLVWLADAYLTDGNSDGAAPLLQRTLSIAPTSAAALYHAGRLALASNDYAAAARHLHAALALNPHAAAVHYPLGMAYRGLGDMLQAERHLARRARDNAPMAPDDPLMREVDRAVGGPLALEVRGVDALNRQDWAAAAAAFDEGTKLAPASASMHHRLGTALAMLGRADEARREFESAIRVSPRYARAHYSLGVLAEDRGDDEAAIARYVAATESVPEYAAARLRLADLLRRQGRLPEALAAYDRAIRADPTLSEATLGRAITLVRMDRHAEARDQLVAARNAYPDHPGFIHALARLLAAAPDAGVRDGRRALALAEELLTRDRSTEAGETLAMALAELGRFGEAAGVQRDLVAAARQARRPDLEGRLRENLRLYDARQPSRTPWRREDVGDAK